MAKQNKIYFLAGQEVDLKDLFNANDFDPEEIQEILDMQPGDEILFGGGAAAKALLQCESIGRKDNE